MLALRAADEDETPECTLIRRLEVDFETAIATGCTEALKNAIMLLTALFVTLKGEKIGCFTFESSHFMLWHRISRRIREYRCSITFRYLALGRVVHIYVFSALSRNSRLFSLGMGYFFPGNGSKNNVSSKCYISTFQMQMSIFCQSWFVVHSVVSPNPQYNSVFLAGIGCLRPEQIFKIS